MLLSMLTNHSPHSQHRKGFTLTEIAIVLGIIGVILGAIWVAAGKVHDNQKIQKAQVELATIKQNLSSMYATTHTMNVFGDATIAMMNMGVFPDDMIMNGQPVSPWGTPVEIYGSWPDAHHFIIEFDGQDRGRTSIPTKYCGPMLLNNYTQTNQDSVGGTVYSVEYVAGAWAPYNISAPEITFSTCTTASFVYSLL